jgi:hypothetical protein
MRVTDPSSLVIPSVDDIKAITFEDLKDDHDTFVRKLKSEKPKAKYCHSTVKTCLIKVNILICILPIFFLTHICNAQVGKLSY